MASVFLALSTNLTIIESPCFCKKKVMVFDYGLLFFCYAQSFTDNRLLISQGRL